MRHRLQRNAGIGALVALLAATAFVASQTEVRAPGVVAADQTFSVSSPEPGRYAWRLESGRSPLFGGVISQGSLQSQRSEFLDVSVPAHVTTGTPVRFDQVVAQLDSQRTVRQMEEQKQAREALVAERDLITAGGRPEAIESAQRAVAVSEAQWWPTVYPDAECRNRMAPLWKAAAADAKRAGENFPPQEVVVRCKDGTDKTVVITGAALSDDPASDYSGPPRS